MKTSRKPQLCTKQLHKRLPKITSKSRISITDNSTWQTMLSYNFIKKLLCYMYCLSVIQRYKHCVFAKPINHSHNTIKILNFWQFSNKVNMNNIPRLIRYRNILLKTILFISISLLPCTFFTPSTIAHHIL